MVYQEDAQLTADLQDILILWKIAVQKKWTCGKRGELVATKNKLFMSGNERF